MSHLILTVSVFSAVYFLREYLAGMQSIQPRKGNK